MSVATARERKTHWLADEESMYVPTVRTACGRVVDPFKGYVTHRGTVTCFACQRRMPVRPESTAADRCGIAYDVGIVQDAGGTWHVYACGGEILSTGDREYALRALKRAIERELAGGT